MKYTTREYLAVIQVEKNADSIFIENVRHILMKSPSNIIYCEHEGRLVGIISTGDIIRAHRQKADNIKINKKYSYVYFGECMKARSIIKEKRNINALPVIVEEGTLVGDYTRWDDVLWMKCVLNSGGGYKNEKWNNWKIALVSPSDKSIDKIEVYKKFRSLLLKNNTEVYCMDYCNISQYMKMVNWILVIDENEARGLRTLCFIIDTENKDIIRKIKTFKSFMESDNIGNAQCAGQLVDLQRQGVTMMGLTWEGGAYYDNLMNQIKDRYAVIGEVPSNMLPDIFIKDFFDDLYNEEYAHEILNIPYAVENNGGVMYLRDCQSRYYNVANGERWTVGQPRNYERTIYFLGACYIYGHWVEDKNTIESFLQKRLCDLGKAVRVVNLGCTGVASSCQYLARVMADVHLKRGDIIVVGGTLEAGYNIEYCDLCKVLEENKVGPEWMMDYPGHCNHKVNKLYADAIFERLQPAILGKVNGQGTVVELSSDFVKTLYLDCYFSKFKSHNYEKLGSIVMNCNPFTYGHRYLIERALGIVDFLIIFVVEEDLSVFSFVERYAMVCDGTADLKNVMVVPSGPFILSRMSFPEYFIKESSEDIVQHVEQDIKTFAEKIALQLGIRYRFVGEEPEDGVTRQYNQAMKRIFPQYGIQLIEISRKTVNGKYVSASYVRKLMDKNDIAKLADILPETTISLIGN